MPAKRERPEENMSDSKAVTGREAFEKWFLTCTEQPTIWEAWQAAQSADREEFELLNSQNRDLAHEVSLLLEQIGVLKAEIEQDGQMFIDSKKLILDAQGRAKSAEHKLTESGEAVKEAQRFVGKVLESQRPEPGDIDGGTIQEWLTECGFYAATEVKEPCDEGEESCDCAEFGFPTTCYRHTEAARAALRRVP